MNELKKRLYHFVNDSKGFAFFIYLLILLNVLAIFLESYHDILLEYGTYLRYFEAFSVFIFTIEYFLRIWVADYPVIGQGRKKRVYARLSFMFSPMGLIDFIAIMPFYLPFLFSLDLRITRIMRLFRLLRIFKLGRYSHSLKAIKHVMRESKSDLSVTAFVLFILLVFSSTLMYFIEGKVQPNSFRNIGDALWWSIATLTTVGYGDIYPVTTLGRILASFIAIIGIGFVALPTGIISSSFIKKIQDRRTSQNNNYCKCPHCEEVFKANDHLIDSKD